MFDRVPLAVASTVSSTTLAPSSREARSRSITTTTTPLVSKRSASPGPGPSTIKIRQLKAAHAHRGREMIGSSKLLGIRQDGAGGGSSDSSASATGTLTTGEGVPPTGTIADPASSGSSSGAASGSVTTSGSTSRAPLFASGTSTTDTVATPTAISPSNPTSGSLTSPLYPTPTLGSGSGTGTPVISPSATPSSSLKVYVPAAGAALQQGDNGLLVNMTLGGDDVDQAVYSVPVVFGHASSSSTRRKTKRNDRGDGVESMNLGKRAGEYQTMRLLVDLGSSDMWIAASTCKTSDCQGSGVNKYNVGLSIDSGQYINLNYHQGSVSGSVYWDEIQIGVTQDQIETSVNGTGRGGATGFDIGFQAFIAADKVQDEDLSGGEFEGILGLALPANSIIQSYIPGSTTGQPDGATFLENLFGLGPGAPIGRYFSMSLERRGDTRTKSSFGLGMYDETVCPGNCTPNYNPVVTSAQGPLYWRILLQGITVSVWPTNPNNATPNVQRISMPSSTTTTQSYPVAVLDSGGSQMLFGSRDMINSIYGAYGIGPASDGIYYMSCTQLISVSFTFNGQEYAVHPIDMSDYTTTSSQCRGSMQYADNLAAGDVILGSSFLKNVYSVYTYPSSSSRTRSNPPLVGLVSLTNSSTAATEFYSVRNQHNPLTPDATGSNGGGIAVEDPTQARKAVSGGIIALSVVLGFVALAGGIFAAWFFWLRRKYGRNGVVLAASRRRRRKGSSNTGGSGTNGEAPGDGLDDDEDEDVVTRARRQKKFRSMQRQKSMIDGYSDFDADDVWSSVDMDGDGTNSFRSSGTGTAVAGGKFADGAGDGEEDKNSARGRSRLSGSSAGVLATLDKGDGFPAAGNPSSHARHQSTSSSPGRGGTEAQVRASKARISAWESSYPPTGWKLTDTNSTTNNNTTGGTSRPRTFIPATKSGFSSHDRTFSASTMDTSRSIDVDGGNDGDAPGGVSTERLVRPHPDAHHGDVDLEDDPATPTRPLTFLPLGDAVGGSPLSPTREALLGEEREMDEMGTGRGRDGETKEYAVGSILGVVDPSASGRMGRATKGRW